MRTLFPVNTAISSTSTQLNTRHTGSHEFSWLLFYAGKENYEQRTIGNHARCDGCQTACGGASHFQSRGIQPTEQPGFPHFADWRAKAGDEAGLTGMVEEPYQRKGVKLRSRAGKNENLPIAGTRTYPCIVQTNSIGKLPHFPGS